MILKILCLIHNITCKMTLILILGQDNVDDSAARVGFLLDSTTGTLVTGLGNPAELGWCVLRPQAVECEGDCGHPAVETTEEAEPTARPWWQQGQGLWKEQNSAWRILFFQPKIINDLDDQTYCTNFMFKYSYSLIYSDLNVCLENGFIL